MIKVPLRILLVEDLKTDIELTTRHLKKIIESPQIQVVDNLEDLRLQLQNFIPDVIIADYNLPTCTGFDILEVTRTFDDSIPFIFLTGTIDDEMLAANTVLAGTSGFILKKHMDHLDEKLKPLLKRIVFNMDSKEELRDKIRRNKIVVNQIYNYIDHIKSDNEEQRENINKIRKNMDQIKLDGDAE